MTDDRKEILNLLAVGPLPPPPGGTTVLFERLVRRLGERDDVSVEVVDTGRVRGRGLAGIAELFRLVAAVGRRARERDVVTLHVSTSGLHVIGPLVALAARLHSTPLVVRKFGGTDFFEYLPLRRCLILWTLRRASLYLAETRDLVERARSAGLENAAWYANNRPMPELPAEHPDDSGCRRFVFLGQVHGGKGVRELVEAVEHLPGSVTVDIYGPLGFDVDQSELDGRERVTYRGPVDPDDVYGVLSKYDALVLPSYHHGEGYPGVILEAYAAGLPVVSTRWRAIPELVDDGATGLLVDPGDAGSLRDAMLSLVEDAGLYARLREGVRARRHEFSDEIWSERFVEYCRALVELPCGDWRTATERHDSGDGGETVSIAFLGDVHLGKRSALELGGRVRAVLTAADLVVANQESPITDLPVDVSGKVGLRSGTEAARVLRDAGIDAVSVANNHIFDCGLPGYLETRTLLDDAGVSAFGAGINLDDAFRPGVIDERGVRVALIACASEATGATVAGPDRHGCAPLDERLVAARIRECASEFDAVVVLVHWGDCDYRVPSPEQAAIASWLLESGATVVVGHHSHVVQGVSRFAGSLVAYSLGDLAFFPYSHRGREIRPSGESLRGAVLTLDIGRNGVASCMVHHTERRAGVVRMDDSRERAAEFSHRCALVARASLEGNWRREVRARLIRRALYWGNPLHWRGIRKEQLAGGGIMMRKIVSRKS